MKKYIFLLLPTFILSQQSIQTITKDFDTSSDSNVEAIVKLNDTKTAAIFSYFGTNTYYNNLHLIDLINKKYELVLQSDYNSFSPTNIFSHNNKLFFKSNYRLYHYDGTSTPTQLLTSYNDNIAYVVINNDLYFVIKGDYRNEFYYYNGTSVTQINPIYNAHFIHYATENKIYFSVKNELNQYDLIEFNKVNDTFNIISTTIEVDQNGYGIEYFKNNLFYAINQENKLFLSKLNSLNENSIIKYQSNGIYVPIKIEEIFRSIKDSDLLLFQGIDENNMNSLFVMNENLDVTKLSNLVHNNIEFNITSNSIKYKTENNIYFTAYNNNQTFATLWAYNLTTNTIELINDTIPADTKEFFIKNNHLVYKDVDTIYTQNLSTNLINAITQNFSEITYITFQDGYFYFSAKEPIHGNELYRLNINDFSYELWMDINREKNTNVLQLMKNNENGYFISDNTMYQYNGENFTPISEKNTTLLPSRFYHYEITNYKQLEDINNKLVFRNIDNNLISIDKNTGTVDNIGYVINNVDDFLEPELFLKYENKIYFFSFDNNQYNINVTDGTTNNTRTLANSNNNYILFNPNYIKYHENHNKIYFISNVHTSSYLNFINPTDDTITTITGLNLSRAIIHHTFGNYLLISGYNQLTRQFELYLSDGQSLGTKIPVTLGSHQITGSFIKDNTIYFTFNNKFYSYNITTGNSNQIFAANYERLFYLKQCGNSFYYKDEFNKQIFRTTGNSTTLIKKFTDDYQNTIGVCNNNVMYYLNDDYVNRTAYTPKKNYIVASTDQQHYEIEIEHEFNNYGRSSSTDIKDLIIIENKILFNYYNNIFGQELLVGNLSNLTLNTTDFPPNVHEDKSHIKIYPNPTANYLNIRTKDNIDEINLYNNNGQLIKIYLNPTKSINLSKYPKGIYYIRIKTNTTTETKKVIKN